MTRQRFEFESLATGNASPFVEFEASQTQNKNGLVKFSRGKVMDLMRSMTSCMDMKSSFFAAKVPLSSGIGRPLSIRHVVQPTWGARHFLPLSHQVPPPRAPASCSACSACSASVARSADLQPSASCVFTCVFASSHAPHISRPWAPRSGAQM
jgi:hypothetical protein